MYCKKCGAIIPSGSTKCEKCGTVFTQNIPESTIVIEPQETETSKTDVDIATPVSAQAPFSPSALKNKLSVWCWLAVTSFCCGVFTLYKGFDKMLNYDSGDYYPYKYVNAYVGGDAYNYIINGTYATAYFVLTAMFVLASIGLVIVHYLAKCSPSDQK